MVVKGDAIEPLPNHEVGAAEVRDELERILASEEFAGSAALHKFLGYCVEQSLGNHSENLKEHSLAVHVFGRREDFDGRIDTIVRVQAHRLRTKLSSYYAGPGREDPVRISIPKGSYRPRFRLRADEPPARQEAVAAEPPSRRGKTGLLVGMFGAGIVAGLIVAGLWGLWGAEQTISPGLRELWGPMLVSKPIPAQIIYRPTVFLSNRAALLRYSGPYEAPTDTPIAEGNSPIAQFVDKEAFEALTPLVFNYSWGAAGLAVESHYLTRLFASAGRDVQLRTVSRLEPNDLGERDLVLLDGDRRANLFERPAFTLESSDPAIDEDTLDPTGIVEFRRIRNRLPADGEPAFFEVEHSKSTKARTVDYGLFSLRRSPDGETATARLSGITTFGGWGAAQYVTSESGAAELVERLGSPLPPSLQAVIRVTIERDTVSSTELVAARAVE